MCIITSQIRTFIYVNLLYNSYMHISYNKLWKKLIDKGWKRKELLLRAQLSPATVAKLGKNQPVNMDVLLRICTVLECDIGDVCGFIS